MKNLLKHKKILALLLLAAMSGMFFWAPWKPKTKKLETFSPEVRDLKKVLSVSGTTDANTKASLRFLAGGKIVNVGAKQGDWVKKNQMIAGIDKRELEKSLNQQLNTFTSTRIDYDQTQETNKDIHGNATVDRTLSKNDLTLRNAALSVELKDLALKNATLYSPFEGVLVSAPTTSPNAIVTVSDVFSIVDPNSLFFDVEVDESNIGLVKVGQSASIVLDAYPNDAIPSSVTSIAFQSSQGDSGTVFRVRLQLPSSNESLKYKLGMNGTAEIQVDQRLKVLSVPMTSIVEKNGQSYVDVMNSKGKVEQRSFKKGIETDEYVEVLDGLSVNDKVVKK